MGALANSFEGGTPGTAVTTANSGGASGDALTRVVADSTVQYTSDAIHGSVAMLCSGTSDAYGGWDSGLSATATRTWHRVYFKLSAIPTSNTNVFRILSATNTIMGTVRINSSGQMAMLYATGSLGGTTTATFSVNTVYRAEIDLTAGATGALAVSFYAGESTTPIETLSVSNVNTGTGNPIRSRFGVLSNSATIIIDSIAASDVGPIGPVGGGPTPIAGTVSATLPALTAAAHAAQTTGAQLAAQLPALGAAIDADIRDTIVLGATLPTLGAAIEAAEGTGAALAATLPPLTATAHLGQTDPGALAAALPALTASLAVDLVEPGGSHLAARLPALTASVEATATTPAAVSSTLLALTAAVETSTVTTAALTATLPPLAAALSAGEPTISGTILAALPMLTAAATSRTVNPATIAAGRLPSLVARFAQTPDVVPIDVTIGDPRTAWGPGAPGVPAWSIGAPSVRRWP